MTDTDIASDPARPRRRHPRHDIQIGAETWRPRIRLAEGNLGVCDKTAQRMNLPTIYVGNVAYCPVNKSLEIVAERAKRRGQKPMRRSPR